MCPCSESNDDWILSPPRPPSQRSVSESSEAAGLEARVTIVSVVLMESVVGLLPHRSASSPPLFPAHFSVRDAAAV